MRVVRVRPFHRAAVATGAWGAAWQVQPGIWCVCVPVRVMRVSARRVLIPDFLSALRTCGDLEHKHMHSSCNTAKAL